MYKVTCPSNIQPDRIDLLSGKMGLVIYWFHCARVYHDETYEEQALMLIDEIQVSISTDISFDYANGLAGIGSAFCYLIREQFIESGDEDIFSDIDAYFFNKVYFTAHTDLNRDTGLIGIGWYLLNRIKIMPTNDHIVSMKLQYLLLILQDIIFAYLGMNGYTYPFIDKTTDAIREIHDIKRFISKMRATGLCPELTRTAISMVDAMEYPDQNIFAALEETHGINDQQTIRCLMGEIVKSRKNTLEGHLAALQLQDMSLPPWWELF